MPVVRPLLSRIRAEYDGLVELYSRQLTELPTLKAELAAVPIHS